MILLSDILDENWYEGSLYGKSGVFPANFVKVRTSQMESHIFSACSLYKMYCQLPLERCKHGHVGHLLGRGGGEVELIKVDRKRNTGLSRMNLETIVRQHLRKEQVESV